MKNASLSELNKLDGLFLTDKGAIHDYLWVYDELFMPYRDKDINIFEVGYQNGGSCKLWTDYFYKAKIKFIDLCPWKLSDGERQERKRYKLIDYYISPESSRATMEFMDAGKLTQKYFIDFPPDIAIDDGSHLISDQIHFIKTVYPILRYGGLLIVEDIQDIDNDKGLFDELNIPYEIIDDREIQDVYDEVLLIFRK